MEERKKPPKAPSCLVNHAETWQSMSRYTFPTLPEEGLGESDFRVLEVLLPKECG
jgi:hypothetical protein